MIRSRLVGEKKGVRRRGGLKLVGSLHSKRGSDWSFPCCVGRWGLGVAAMGLLWKARTGGKLRKERKGKETVLLPTQSNLGYLPSLSYHRQNSRHVPLALPHKYVDKSPLTEIPLLANPLAENRRVKESLDSIRHIPNSLEPPWHVVRRGRDFRQRFASSRAR